MDSAASLEQLRSDPKLSSAFNQLFATFVSSYRNVIEPNAVDDLPVHPQTPNLPAAARIPPEKELDSSVLSEAVGPEVDSEIARPGHFQNMAKAPPGMPSKGPNVSMQAPSVPFNPRIGAALAKRAKQVFDEDPEGAKAQWDSMKERLDELAYIVNPYVARNRQAMLNAHSTFLELYEPELSSEAHWFTDTIIQFAGNTLVYRVCCLFITNPNH
jgi:hypothetical protein